MLAKDLAPVRLHRQRLTGPPFATPEDAVYELLAIQSQEYAVSKWSLGLRTAGLDEADVDAMLDDGRLVRTHVLRPTWHYVLRDDLRWLLTATAPRVHTLNGLYYRRVGDEATFERLESLLADAIRDENHLTREEIASVLRGHGFELDGVQLSYLLMHAELTALICSGRPQRGRHTYALLEERVQPEAPLSTEEAQARLAQRYFQSHGPATLKDFTAWSSLSTGEARRAITAVDGIERMEVEGLVYWYTGNLDAPALASPVAHLLQGYDEYFTYNESKRVFDAAGLAGKVPPGTALFVHALVIDGQVAGHWRRVQSGKQRAIEVQLVRPVTRREHAAIEAAIERYTEFTKVEARLEIVFTPT